MVGWRGEGAVKYVPISLAHSNVVSRERRSFIYSDSMNAC